MAEFPKQYINRHEKGGRTVKMFLADGTVLDENAEPIEGPGLEAKKAREAEKKAPEAKLTRSSLKKAAEAASRLTSSKREESEEV